MAFQEISFEVSAPLCIYVSIYLSV